MDNPLSYLTQGRVLVPSCASPDQLNYIAKETDWPCIMLKMGEVGNIRGIVNYIHKHGKKVMVHLDSLKGIAKDKEGARYLKQIGVDAIISMRAQFIRTLHDAGMVTILGAFLVDSASVNQTIQNVRNNKPDILCSMPVTVPDEIYRKLLDHIQVPIMAGGLGVDAGVIDHAISCGVQTIAVTDRKLVDHYAQKYQ